MFGVEVRGIEVHFPRKSHGLVIPCVLSIVCGGSESVNSRQLCHFSSPNCDDFCQFVGRAALELGFFVCFEAGTMFAYTIL